VAEPYSSVQLRMGALQAVFYSGSRMPCVMPRPGGTVSAWRITKRPSYHEEAMRRIGTTARGYLQLWAMNWAVWAPRWGSLQVSHWYFRSNQSWSWSGRAWA